MQRTGNGFMRKNGRATVKSYDKLDSHIDHNQVKKKTEREREGKNIYILINI